MPYCEPCDHFFYDDRVYDHHRITSDKHNYCVDCNVDFASPVALNYHYIHSPSHHYCNWCNKDFSTDDELDKHDDRLHCRCMVCEDMFRNEDDLGEHIRKRHKLHYCSFCGDLFQTKPSLEQHLNIHHYGVTRTNRRPWPFSLNRPQSMIKQSSPDHHFKLNGSPIDMTDPGYRQIHRNDTSGKVGHAVSSIAWPWTDRRSYTD